MARDSRLNHREGEAKRPDGALTAVVWVSGILSLLAFVATVRAGNVLAYNDAISHMQIARRVMFGSDPSLAQLGNVWLPLPHVLMMPFIGFDTLYYSGVAGAVVSMMAFVACCVFIYKILYQLTGKKSPGLAGAAVFALNANALYMQSTPMTEMLLFALILSTIWCLQVWTDRYQYRYLVGAAASALAATLTRYEAWVILGVLTGVVIFAALRERRHFFSIRQRLGRTVDLLCVFAALALIGVVFWGFWNRILFGGFMNFKNGDYAKPSLWLTNSEPAIGNWALSAKTFWYATLENVPWQLLLVAGVGLVAFVMIEMIAGKFNPRSLVVPSLLLIVPFFVYAIYTGERPLHVLQINGSLYNVRFGLIMALPTALFAGYFVALLRKMRVMLVVFTVLVVGLAGLTAASDITKNHIVTLNDPVAALKEDRAVWAKEAADAFEAVYDDGDVLVETFGNERFAFETIPSEHTVYEGTNTDGRWKQALADPAGAGITWIVMRCVPGYEDRVCTALRGNTSALAGYDLRSQLVIDGRVLYLIYRKEA